MYRLSSLNGWFDGMQFDSLAAAKAKADCAAQDGVQCDVYRDIDGRTFRVVYSGDSGHIQLSSEPIPVTTEHSLAELIPIPDTRYPILKHPTTTSKGKTMKRPEMYTVEVKAIGGWTRHSDHDSYGDAVDQADLVHGRVVDRETSCVVYVTTR